MSPRANLGEFEHMVLLAILRRGADSYGVTIHEEIESIAGRRTRRGAVYVALERLERKGLTASRVGGAAPERGGRSKRLYDLTDDGREALRASREALMRLWDGVESDLERAR